MTFISCSIFKNALNGDATNLLADYPLTGGIYRPAFEHVKQRYFNKRAIIAENFREQIDCFHIELATLHKPIYHLQDIERGRC